MRRIFVLIGFLLCLSALSAQEVLMPLKHRLPAQRKAGELLTLPFFDDFSDTTISYGLWQLGGANVNQGYAPLPPTVGMVTLDAFDADGCLYPTVASQLVSGDSLTSLPMHLDSLFSPYPRALTPSDSVYLSFFYLPGGGYGNMWERLGDTPEGDDSLILEFYAPNQDVWSRVWSTAGCQADSLFARTGSYWQFVDLLIDDTAFLQRGFRFRFRNYCSLDNVTKKGILSNADQWNVDYVMLNADRHRGDSTSRDLAFVNPAPSLLRSYQAMPARQYVSSEMKDSLSLTITNRYSDELASNFGFRIYDGEGQEVHAYVGGYENVPVYWQGYQYQASQPHARPVLDYAFPEGMTAPTSFVVEHGVREGVRGDAYPQNDTVRFTQVFDNYFAYDDGTPENGYGITSTSSRVRLACRFHLNAEDTLSAVMMYFNRTLDDENEEIRFYITVWDDADGVPGNIIYRDVDRRSPLFEGFNRFVRYDLEEPLVCSGTIYVGFEQTTADYINLGFDRNNDASDQVFFLTSATWQTSILRGALMLRPYFGQLPTLSIGSQPEGSQTRAFCRDGRIVIATNQQGPVAVYDVTGREVFRQRRASGSALGSGSAAAGSGSSGSASAGSDLGSGSGSAAAGLVEVVTERLPRGIYLVRVGTLPAKKVVVL